MIKILLAAWSFIADTIAGFFRWLQQPGSKTRLFAGVLAFGFVVASLSALDREQRRKETQEQLSACRDANQALVDKAEGYARSLGEISVILNSEARELESLRGKNAEELKKLAELIQQSQHQAAEWQRKYSQRPDECRVALELLDTVCSGLEGY